MVAWILQFDPGDSIWSVLVQILCVPLWTEIRQEPKQFWDCRYPTDGRVVVRQAGRIASWCLVCASGN